jgi:hypothetical protein
MNIGLIPMSAKPYHLGHHMLVEFAALGALGEELIDEAPENDLVLVFISYSSRGTKAGTKASRGREVPIPGDTPVFGQDMMYIWEELLIPNLELPSNVMLRTPLNGAPKSPIRGVFDVLDAVHEAKVTGSTSVKIPYTDISDDPEEVVLTIYSDSVDIEQNYPNDYMSKKYPESYGTTIRKYGVPRSSTVQISGTKMREMICSGDREGFIPMLPPLPKRIAEEVFDTLSTSVTQMCPRSEWKKVGEGIIRNMVREIL